MRRVIIASGVRTSLGSLNGIISNRQVTELGSLVIGAAIDRANLDARDIDCVCLDHQTCSSPGQEQHRLPTPR